MTRKIPDHDEHGRINHGSRRHAIVLREAKKWLAKDILPREAEYVEWLKVWIVQQNAKYVERAKKLPTVPEHIRHRNVVDKVTWYWSDALWCGDVSTTHAPEEFFQQTWWDHANPPRGREDEEQRWCIYYDAAQEFVNECFDKAFREVMPSNLHHVLEG